METIDIRALEERDIISIVLAFHKLGWNKPESQYRSYLKQQQAGERQVQVALVRNQFAGYVTLKWMSDYPYFRSNTIPEISDLNVLPEFRQRGIATQLISVLETLVASHNHKRVGIGVGMTNDYGNAQRLYVRLGYVPDGFGLTSYGLPVQYGSNIPVDDDLVLWFIKKLDRNDSHVF